MENSKVNARSYANLTSYARGSYGKGVVAPYFAMRPFRTNFARGETNDPDIVFHKESCDYYNVVDNKNNIVNPKMIRQKK